VEHSLASYSSPQPFRSCHINTRDHGACPRGALTGQLQQPSTFRPCQPARAGAAQQQPAAFRLGMKPPTSRRAAKLPFPRGAWERAKRSKTTKPDRPPRRFHQPGGTGGGEDLEAQSVSEGTSPPLPRLRVPSFKRPRPRGLPPWSVHSSPQSLGPAIETPATTGLAPVEHSLASYSGHQPFGLPATSAGAAQQRPARPPLSASE
jgi:hypothetical protein